MNAQKAGTALITGASSGLGAAFARKLAARGHGLVLVARREDRLAALAAELAGRHPIAAEVLAADLASMDGIERVERRIAELGALEILVNNAGFGTTGAFAEVEIAKHLEMIQVHVVASVRLSRSALPAMLARSRGAIINVSLLAAIAPQPGDVTYCAAKAYLRVFSETLHAELKGTGVCVQALLPGFTSTEFHDRPDIQGFDRSRIPRAFWMSPDRVAEASLRALERGRRVCIPGFKNRVLAALAGIGVPSLLWKVLAPRGREPLRRHRS
ncbi:MAG TPA: SDR family oxidoreductase [Planctomycetota bacterium]|nr:SDR family oxidoreductase [Planctomycetota bacterium]